MDRRPSRTKLKSLAAARHPRCAAGQLNACEKSERGGGTRTRERAASECRSQLVDQRFVGVLVRQIAQR